jgi:hypothetical protein
LYQEKVRARENIRGGTRRPVRARKKVYKDDRAPVVVEIDDETDADMASVLYDWSCPLGIDMVNIGFVPGSMDAPYGEGRTVTVLLKKKMSQAASQYRMKVAESSRGGGRTLPQLNLAGILTHIFKDAYLRLCVSIRQLAPCHVLGLTHSVNILEGDTVEIMISAIAHELTPLPKVSPTPRMRSLRLKLRSDNPDINRISDSHTRIDSPNLLEGLYILIVYILFYNHF